MPETVYLTREIKDMLVGMVFGKKEKMNLLLGERVSNNEIYVVNRTVPFDGEATSVSLKSIPGFDNILSAALIANQSFRQKGGTWDRFLLFSCHSHPRLVGEIVPGGYEAWSVDDVPKKYENVRGRVTSANDRNGNLLHFCLKLKSDGHSGDDVFFKLVAEKWSLIKHQFFVRPPIDLVGKPMTQEVALYCYEYDPDMQLGKIRQIPIAKQVLTTEQLRKTILDPGLPLYNVEEETGKLVLPYKKRKT